MFQKKRILTINLLFPIFFQDGKNEKDEKEEEKKIPLGDQDYWGQLILYVGERCGHITELKQMNKNINL